ncbi:MAG: translation initiation factor IF-2, partial [Planctomycetota bacterium]
MPKRIYALAKELAMDSKELVELCTKIGIPNKGSALASLEDDEVEKLEKHLAGAGKSEEAPAPTRMDSPIRPSTTTRTDKPRVLDLPARSKTQTEVEQAEEELVQEEPEEMEVEQAVSEEPPQEVVAEETPAAGEEEKTDRPISRDDYISSGGASGRVRSLDKNSGDAPAKEERKRPGKREPVIKVKMAQMPKSDKPLPKPKSTGPAPQRPEIRFTKDDISGQKQGMKAPVQQQMEQQQAAASESRARPGAKTGGLKGFKDAADRAKGRHREGEDEDGKGRKKGAGIAAARAERRRRGRGIEAGDDDSRPHRSGKRLVRKGTNTAAPRKEKAILELPCTVRSFSEAAGVPAGRVVGTLMQMGHGVTINSNLETELAEMVALELGVELEFKQPESLEEGVIDAIETSEDAPEDLTSRPPIVTFLGHVDHGKTSLLDYLIGTQVVDGEAGGITQHIRAYQVEKDGQIISFVDTPGHEAFTEMRARGANVTDIAVLVVAADDGIMPQTEEAISHAKAAGVPIVVALNKVDIPGVDANRVLTQMTEHELTPSEWGGDVEVVKTSAISGEGMDDLLETLLTVAELHEYKANASRPGIGVCMESEQASNRGVIAKVVVQNGTLRVGDVVLCGTSYGRVKAIYDTLHPNKQISEAGPSMPVNITGLDTAPGAGDRFYVLDDIAQARELAESRSDVSREESLAGTSPKVSFIDFQQQLQDGTLGKVEEKVQLNLIIRADAR